VEISRKLREGSETAFAEVLHRLGGYGLDASRRKPLDDALEALRSCDAKHRLAFALTRAAILDVAYRQFDAAEQRAAEALRAAEILKRPSEIAIARSILIRVLPDRRMEVREHRQQLSASDRRALSSRAQAIMKEVGIAQQVLSKGAADGNGRRGKVVRRTH
jgi:hypothetical protein